MPAYANQPYAHKQRWLLGLGLTALTLMILIGIAFAWLIIREGRAADYPGALLVSEHNIYAPFPRLHVRRDTSYRTLDDFPAVYNWYSNRFNLGPERQAQSGCIHLFDSTTSLAFRRNMSVTVCDTPNGRMIFVQRSTSFPKR